MDRLFNLFTSQRVPLDSPCSVYHDILKTLKLFVLDSVGDFVPISYKGLVNYYSSDSSYSCFFLFEVSSRFYAVDVVSLRLGRLYGSLSNPRIYYIPRNSFFKHK